MESMLKRHIKHKKHKQNIKKKHKKNIKNQAKIERKKSQKNLGEHQKKHTE